MQTGHDRLPLEFEFGLLKTLCAAPPKYITITVSKNKMKIRCQLKYAKGKHVNNV